MTATRFNLKFGFVLSLLLLGTSSAFAHLNAEFDTNGDGTVSTAELQTGLTNLFIKIDTDNDGYLTLTEVQAWRESSQVALFNALDTDKSNTLSLAELQADTKAPQKMSAKLFSLLDGDKNNTLSMEEFSLLGPGKMGVIRHFDMMDTDGDSKISQTEFLAAKSNLGHNRANVAGSNKTK